MFAGDYLACRLREETKSVTDGECPVVTDFLMIKYRNLFKTLANLRVTFPAALCAAVEIEQYVRAVHEAVHDCSQDKSGHHIEQRVLFDEYGGQYDGNAQD